MANALIFATILAILIPLAGTIFQLMRGIFTGVTQVTGVGIFFDLMEVLDACLPFSFIQFMGIFALTAGSIAAFITARKIASVFTSLFSGAVK